jgi:hypothetical protein
MARRHWGWLSPAKTSPQRQECRGFLYSRIWRSHGERGHSLVCRGSLARGAERPGFGCLRCAAGVMPPRYIGGGVRRDGLELSMPGWKIAEGRRRSGHSAGVGRRPEGASGAPESTWRARGRPEKAATCRPVQKRKTRLPLGGAGWIEKFGISSRQPRRNRSRRYGCGWLLQPWK